MKYQEEALQAPSSWERLMVLLDAQAQTGTMDVGEARQVSRLIKPEDLDMVFREFRSVKGSALSRLNVGDDLGEG